MGGVHSAFTGVGIEFPLFVTAIGRIGLTIPAWTAWPIGISPQWALPGERRVGIEAPIDGLVPVSLLQTL